MPLDSLLSEAPLRTLKAVSSKKIFANFALNKVL